MIDACMPRKTIDRWVSAVLVGLVPSEDVNVLEYASFFAGFLLLKVRKRCLSSLYLFRTSSGCLPASLERSWRSLIRLRKL